MNWIKKIANVRIAVAVAILLVSSACVQAQKSTEVFIPIGKSPGVSGKYSVMGKVDQLRYTDSTLTIQEPSGFKSIRVNSSTEIYLDKSRLKQSNKMGSWSDVKSGLTAEVKYTDNKPGAPAEWIKLLLE